MGFSAPFRSELFRARRVHAGLLLLGLYLGIALSYAFASSGAWVSAGGKGRFIGFSADPSYFKLIGAGTSEAERLIAVSLAHTALFPVVAVLVTGMFFDVPARGAAEVSQARGVGEFDRYLVRIAVCCLYLVAAYAAFSALAFAAYCAIGLARFDAAAALFLVRKLVPNAMVDASFVVLCVSVFTLLRIRSLASGGLLVLTYAGLVAAMSSPDSIVPAHMAYWIRTCGISGADETLGAITFSMASSVLCVIAAGALLKVRQNAR